MQTHAYGLHVLREMATFVEIIHYTMKRLLTLCLALTIINGAVAQMLPYQDITLTHEERARDLVSRMTLDEKIQQMQNNAPAIPRLGVESYEWWNEALHGVARAGLATVFPQTIGMAASFDGDLIERVFTAVSDEARAKHRRFVDEGSRKRYQGLSVWTPNINIFRDPRWGRGQETYGEDPYLTSQLGLAVVRGLQGDNSAPFDKLHACAKHYAVHSGPEWNRHSFDAHNISQRDLWETYLPAFEALVREGGVKEVMGAYNRFEGVPCNSSHYLLSDILRKEWGFEGIVVSDCGAIRDFFRKGDHETHADAAEASAAAVKAGCDLECGSSYKALREAVSRGLITEEEIDRSVERLMVARMEMGLFEADDPFGIPYSVVDCEEHRALAREIARKSIVLMQNRDNLLPLSRDMKVALVGPNADNETMQWGNYNGTPSYTITLREALEELLPDGVLIYEPLCGHTDEVSHRSLIGECRSKSGDVGFDATYWNNLNFSGEVAATDRIAHPFNFCVAGNTVFAPNVALDSFSAIYQTTFTPKSSSRAVFRVMTNEQVILFVNGEQVAEATNVKTMTSLYAFDYHAGNTYNIEVRYAGIRHRTDATLRFDFAEAREVDVEAFAHSIEQADVVIFAGGISPQLEGEEMPVAVEGFRGGDRESIELPKVQRDAIAALHRAGKRIVLVNFSGSALALVPETECCDAIIQAWYPGQEGGAALTDIIYGEVSPSGKLPVTFYRSTEQLPDFQDYNMKGHTYRYFAGNALFCFGHGLSYAEFSYSPLELSQRTLREGKSVIVGVDIENRGSYDGEEVVQLYISRKGDTDGPLQTLRAFRRVSIPKGESRHVEFTLTPNDLRWFCPTTNRMRAISGDYIIRIGGTSDIKQQQRAEIRLK